MTLSSAQKEQIKTYLISKIREKLTTYTPETTSMPFHYRLLGKDRMALFSFIQSINTTLGVSIFEKVGVIIAAPQAKTAIDRYDLKGYISDQAVLTIDQIIRGLKTASGMPNKEQETKEIIAKATQGDLGKEQRSRIDLFMVSKDGTEYYFEVKTAKPNIREFLQVKNQLLDWIAMRASSGDKPDIKTIVAIPYNPYEPRPYERWTLKGLFDLDDEVMVAEEFWDFLGGKGTYEDLLDVFEQAGLELYNEIDTKMKEIGKS